MVTPQSPITVTDDGNDDDDTPIPSYLSCPLPLGIDADDVAALISSIDSSQIRAPQSSASPLPHLPAEILLHVLNYVPVDYVWDWRRVCRGFRDAIDGRILYDYLQRTELIAYLGPRRGGLLHLTEEDYEKISMLRMHFHHSESLYTNRAGTAKQAGARWNHGFAVFCNQDGWRQKLEEMKTLSVFTIASIIESLMDPEKIREEAYGTLRWCFKLDTTVLDVGFPIEAIIQVLEVDWTNGTAGLPWKHLLLDFLRTATRVRKLMTEKAALPAFTFSLHEDCLRSTRRQHLRTTLSKKDQASAKTLWAMNLLRPLFGKPRYDKASAPWDDLETAEDEALKLLLMLQKEASMDPLELAYLQQLVRDRTAMGEELEYMNRVFATWKSNVYGTPPVNTIDFEQMPPVAKNPFVWDEETVEREGQRVGRWRTQRRMIEQMVTLLEASNEALEAPEDAFDILGSGV